MSVQLGRLVSAVVLLRDVLRCLPVMADSMAWVESAVLKVGWLAVCVYPCKGPLPRGLSGTGIDGWLGGDFDRPHT
jgi:hypothetical protein